VKGVSAVVPAEAAAEVHKVVENAFSFELEVVERCLLANKEESTISDVPETCIESIVRVGDRFYDLNNGMRTGVVVSFPSENLAGVIFDIDKSFHVFPAFLFGNRFVYVRTTAFFYLKKYIVTFTSAYYLFFFFFFAGLLGYTCFLRQYNGAPGTDTFGDNGNSCSFKAHGSSAGIYSSSAF
jgi:hypothetical protein